jgi:C-terminal domain on Strawberry notch homologue
LIRREHDLSNIRIEVIDDLDRIDRNRAYVDALAPILSQMAVMGRRVTEIAEEKTAENAELLKELSAAERKAAREKVYTMNFGAVLSALVRQVVTALLVDKCVEECVETLRGGEKPVVVIETTMEALMRDLAKGSVSEDGGVEASPPLVPDDAAAAEEELESESVGAEAGARPPDYRDALRLAVQRLSELIVRKGTDDPIRVPVEEVDVVAMRNALLKAIGELPDLSLSPIDDLRERVEARGRALFEAGEIDRPWACDEISARSMRVANGIYETMPARDRNAVIAGFNGGRTDMVEVTRAGSTGLSLHASERVKDQRRRIMIELQIPSNVVERVQFWGRVNRRGQVCEPGFKTLSTQARNLAMQNRKVAQLSANVSASAENATAMDVPDIIDQTGNEICKRILTERPALADRMSIAVRGIDEEQAAEELYYVNKLLQRLVLLPAAEQAALYNEVIELYEDAMRELTAQGKHPHHGRELGGAWEVEKRELFDAGNPADGPVFGRPVWLATLKGVRDAVPLSSAAIETMIDEARARLAAAHGEVNDLGYFAHQAEVLRRRTDGLLAEALPQNLPDVKTALNMVKPNAVKIRQATLRDLRNLITRAQPGAFVTAPDEENVPTTGRVVDVRPPDDDGVHLPGRWILRYVLPGDERPREISFATMLRERIFSVQPTPSQSDFRRLMMRYDAVPSGQVEQRRLMLEGNLVASVRIAAEGRLGTAAAWTDLDGRRRRGVLIPKGRQAEIGSLPGSTFCKEAAFEVLKRGGRLEAIPSRPGDGVVIKVETDRGGQRLVVELPAEPKPVAERLRRGFEKADLRFEENYGILSASVPFAAASKVLATYMDSTRPLYFHGRFRALALASTASLREQKAEPDAEPQLAPAP